METWTTMIALVFTTIISLSLGLYVGKTTQRIKELEERSSLTLLASLWATVEAKGLQRSTIIQRIVEKYTPVNTLSAEARKKMEDEIEKLSGFEPEEFILGKKDSFPFDEELKQDARELV